jgi:hypothetical protein
VSCSTAAAPSSSGNAALTLYQGARQPGGTVLIGVLAARSTRPLFSMRYELLADLLLKGIDWRVREDWYFTR